MTTAATATATSLPMRLDAMAPGEALALLRAVAELRPQSPTHASERMARWQQVAERVATEIQDETITASTCSRRFRMLLAFDTFYARDQWPVGDDVRLLLANALDDQLHRSNQGQEPSWDTTQEHQQDGASTSHAEEKQQRIHESMAHPIAQDGSVQPQSPPSVVVPVAVGTDSSATPPVASPAHTDGTTGTPSTPPPVSTEQHSPHGAKRSRDSQLDRSQFFVRDDMALLRAVANRPQLHALQCWQRVADAVLTESGKQWTSDECRHRYTVLLDRCASNQWPEDLDLCGLVQAAYVGRAVHGNRALSAELKHLRDWPRSRLERPADEQRPTAAAAAPVAAETGKRKRPRGPRQRTRPRTRPRRGAPWNSLKEPEPDMATHSHSDDGVASDAVPLSTPNETQELPTTAAAAVAMPEPALKSDVLHVGMASMAAVGSDISDSDDDALVPTHHSEISPSGVDQTTCMTESANTLTKWQHKRQTQRTETRPAKLALHEEVELLKQTVATLVSKLTETNEDHEELKRHVAVCCLKSEETKPDQQQQQQEQQVQQREEEAKNERDGLQRQLTELRAELELEKSARLQAIAALTQTAQCIQEQLDQHVLTVPAEIKQLREVQDLQTTALETCKNICESEVESVTLQLQKLKKTGDYERRKHRESLVALKAETVSDHARLELSIKKMEESVRRKTNELEASIEHDRSVALESVQNARDALMVSWKVKMQQEHHELRTSLNESLHALKRAHHERLNELASKIAWVSASFTEFRAMNAANDEKSHQKELQVDEQLISLTRQLQQVAERGQQNQGELLEAITLELNSRATELQRSLQNVLERDQQTHHEKIQQEIEELRETLATGVSSFDELLETMQADQRARLLAMDTKIDANSSISKDLQASVARHSQRSRLKTLEQESQMDVELRELRSLVDAERLERTREYTKLLRNIQVIVAGDEHEPDE